MSTLAPLVVAVVLLLIMLGVAKRYLASMGVPSGWVSVPRMVRGCWRILAATISGTWRVGRGLVRVIQGRRRVRRRTSRVSIGNFK